MAKKELPRGRGPDPTEASHRQSISPPKLAGYRVRRDIGTGGMGEVYEAEQLEPVRRTVALKIIKHGLNSKDVIARFESERQALALMEHPNIAKVFDAGATEDGRPYFAMEYVPGKPITEFCDAGRLSIRERLALFIDVCEGVQHAHRKAIIHRDLKPSNIIVAVQDGKPVAKIIDFGVAKATEQHLSDTTVYTELGRLLGTPEYMSPEQAEMTGDNVDTRTDIYSLGIVLYELLAGEPFDWKALRQSGFDEMLRTIRHDDPPRPSTHVRTRRDDSIERAKSRRTTPERLQSRLRGDLDWITMKAIKKNPAERYGTPSELADDIRRHLTHAPVLAGPPSIRYNVAKFVRRNRVLVGGVLATLVTLAAGAAIATLLAIRIARTNEELQRTSYRFAIGAASKALDNEDRALAREILQAPEIPASLRQWEWRHLWSRAQPDGITIDPSRDSDYIIPSFGFDGDDLVCHAGGRRLRFDTATGALLDSQPFEQIGAEAFDTKPRFMNLSPDRRYIAAGFSGNGGDSVRFFRSTGEPCGETPGTGARFGPPGSEFAAVERMFTASGWMPVQIWDLASRSERFTVPGNDCVALSPDGSWMLACTTTPQETEYVVSNMRTGEVKIRFRHKSSSRSAAFSPNGATIALGGFDGDVRVVDLSTGDERLSLPAHRGAVLALLFAADGGWIASSGDDRGIRLWDSRSGRPLADYKTPTPAEWLQASGDARLLACAGRDHVVTVLEISSQEQPWVLHGHENYVYAVDFHPGGDMFATADFGGHVYFWDAHTYERIAELAGPHAYIQSLRFSADGSRLVALSRYRPIDVSEYAVCVWDVDTGTLLSALETEGPWLSRAVGQPLDPSADRIITEWAPEHDEWTIWNVATGRTANEPISPMEQTDPAWLSGDGRFALRWETDGLRVHDLGRGSERTLPAAMEYWAAVFSHGLAGPTLVVAPLAERAGGAEARSTLGVWEAATGAYVGALEGHSREVLCVTFSSDDRRIATGSRDGTIRIWDRATLQEIATLTGHSLYVKDLAFSPDGSVLISVSGDRTARVWDTVPRQQRLTARRHQHRDRSEAERFVSSLPAEDTTTAQMIARVKAMPGLEAGLRREALRELRRISIRNEAVARPPNSRKGIQ